MRFRPRMLIWHHSFSSDHPVKYDWGYIKRLHTSWRYFDGRDTRIVTKDEAMRLVAHGKHVTPPWNPPCGYNGGIERVNGILVFHAGRPWDQQGAHCYGHNHESLGFVVVGNFDEVGPRSDAYLTAATVNVQAMKRYPDLDRPASQVVFPHSAFSTKTCPGLRFDIELLRHTTDAILRIS